MPQGGFTLRQDSFPCTSEGRFAKFRGHEVISLSDFLIYRPSAPAILIDSIHCFPERKSCFPAEDVDCFALVHFISLRCHNRAALNSPSGDGSGPGV